MERFRTHYLTTESAYASTNSGRVYMWMRNRAILCSRHGKRPLPNEDLGWLLLQHCGHCGEQKVARSGLGRIRNIIPPKRRFWKEEQKIQVRGTKDTSSRNKRYKFECVFEPFFKDVSTRFGRRIVEKCFENTLGKVCAAFENLRLGGKVTITKGLFRRCTFL